MAGTLGLVTGSLTPSMGALPSSASPGTVRQLLEDRKRIGRERLKALLATQTVGGGMGVVAFCAGRISGRASAVANADGSADSVGAHPAGAGAVENATRRLAKGNRAGCSGWDAPGRRCVIRCFWWSFWRSRAWSLSCTRCSLPPTSMPTTITFRKPQPPRPPSDDPDTGALPTKV